MTTAPPEHAARHSQDAAEPQDLAEPPAAKPKRRLVLIGAAAAVLLFLVAAVVTAWLNSGQSGPTTKPGAAAPAKPEQQQGQSNRSGSTGGRPAGIAVPTRHDELAVTGAGPVSIAYDTTGTGLVRRESGIAPPWHDDYKWPANQPLQVVQLLVQSTGDKPVTCTVTVDGKVAVTKSSTAAKPVAVCYAKFTPTH